MTKRFCDRCGKEVGVYKDFEFQTWWTITRHGMMDLTTEFCDACYQAKFEADEPQTSGLVWTEDAIKDEPKSYTTWASTDETQTYITEDRDTQILDAWQVNHRNTTSVEDKPQTERSE